MGHQEPCEIQRGQTQSPGSGKEETFTEIQARAAWQGCILSRSSVTQQQPQGQGAEGGPVLTVPSPMRNRPMELVWGPLRDSDRASDEQDPEQSWGLQPGSKRAEEELELSAAVILLKGLTEPD